MAKGERAFDSEHQLAVALLASRGHRIDSINDVGG